MSLANILLVIDPSCEQQTAFARALETCASTGAKLTLFACIDQAESSVSGNDLEQLLSDLQTQARDQDVDANTELLIQDNWPRAVVDAARRLNSDMLFKRSFDHSARERATRETSDWLLLREAPCPVMLIKEHRDWSNRLVLAAIKTQAGDPEHSALNEAIIRFSNRLADVYGSQVHYISAYQGRIHKPDRDELSELCGVPGEQVHIAEGWPDAVISRAAADLAADLVVIGTVGRTGIVGRTIGNTAEKLVDQTQSDMLVMNTRSAPRLL